MRKYETDSISCSHCAHLDHGAVLAACGEEPGTNENTENGQNQTSSNETGKTVDLAALRTQFVTDYSLTDVLEVETEGLNNLYGITEGRIPPAFPPPSGAAFAQEVVMVEAVDESAAATVAEKLETRLSTIAEQAASLRSRQSGAGGKVQGGHRRRLCGDVLLLPL